MKRKVFKVEVKMTYRVAIDESLTPDNEWRSLFFNYQTLAEMAGHIVWSKCVMKNALVPGVSLEGHNSFEIVESGTAITDVVEVE